MVAKSEVWFDKELNPNRSGPFIFMKSDYSRYDDERLIRLITDSQEEALAQLYDRYHRLVFSLAFTIVNDRATAEEITLDVFMRVWQKAGTYRADQAKVSTWLTHITRHHAIDVLRRRAVRSDQYAVQWEEIVYAEFPQQDPQESAELSMRRERVHAALAQLPPDQKQAILLAYFGGLTQTEIAERTGLAFQFSAAVPFGERAYYANRPSIAIPRPGATGGAIDLDGFFGLFVDNLVQLLLIVGLCRALCGMTGDDTGTDEKHQQHRHLGRNPRGVLVRFQHGQIPDDDDNGQCGQPDSHDPTSRLLAQQGAQGAERRHQGEGAETSQTRTRALALQPDKQPQAERDAKPLKDFP